MLGLSFNMQLASPTFTKKIGVLQVLPALMSGGVEREVLDISASLAKAGYRSFVASSGGGLVPQVYQCGSRHLDLPLQSKNPIVMIQNIFKLAHLIKMHDIDIVHAQSRAPAWSAYYAAKLTKCHFITTIHGAHSISGSIKRYYNSVMTKGEKIIAVSEFIADYAKTNYSFDHNNLEVVHCGVDIDKFNYDNIEENRLIDLARTIRIPTEKPIILLPGRLSRNKGHLFLLEALKRLPLSSFTCLFVGNYTEHLNYKKELQDKIKEYGLQDNVIITGNVSDMPAIYALSDIVACVSTKPEAFGLVSIEGQAMGRSVVVSNIGGIKETIIPGETGWPIEPNNVDQLTSTLHMILSFSLEERLKRAKLAREHIEKNFSLASMGEKIINIYNQLC